MGVAPVSTIGWLGFLAGPPAIGLAAGVVGLRNSLAIVVLATVMVALLSRSAGPRRREELRSLAFEPRAVLSDLDGVLVDSGAEVERTWRRFAARHGLDAEYVVAKSHGRRSIDLIRLVAPHLDAGAEAAGIDEDQIERAGGLEALPGRGSSSRPSPTGPVRDRYLRIAAARDRPTARRRSPHA